MRVVVVDLDDDDSDDDERVFVGAEHHDVDSGHHCTEADVDSCRS